MIGRSKVAMKVIGIEKHEARKHLTLYNVAHEQVDASMGT